MLSGVHGIGKTTAVNNLNINKPIVKYVDIDLIGVEGTGLRQQMIRATTMLDISYNMIHHIDIDMNVIYDRSPFDFLIYNKYLEKKEERWDLCNSLVEAAIYEVTKLHKDITHILVTDTFDSVWDKISNRDRDQYDESNKKYTKEIYDMFYSLEEDGLIKSSCIKFITVPIDELNNFLEQFFEM